MMVKNTKNNKNFYIASAFGIGAGALTWLLLCALSLCQEDNNNQTGVLTDFEKPKINAFTGKTFTKYSKVGIDITGDNEADFYSRVRKWDNDIKVGDTVKLSSPFLLMPLHEMYRKKMEKVH